MIIKPKYLVISDIHNRVNTAQSIIDSVEHDFVIFLGDYFDAWDDNASDAYITARWLKRSLQNPSHIHMMGNHDIAYRYSHEMQDIDCPGWTQEKQIRINEVLTPDDWSNIKFYHRIDNWMFLHAGLHKRYFEHPIDGFSLAYVEEVCLDAKAYASMRMSHPIFSYGGRMGYNYPGGIFWLHWPDFDIIEGVNQVVGHTLDLMPRTLHFGDSKNYCIDTGLTHYGIFQDGKFDVFVTRTNKKLKL